MRVSYNFSVRELGVTDVENVAPLLLNAWTADEATVFELKRRVGSAGRARRLPFKGVGNVSESSK